ncbi:hypothetical protein EYF80_048742 [Liparis tanakae]|uniref:Uncharacterized protein n=1 Tax=Liparis tanakae TaxID=230148 RepID=A0A4Z2FIQ8_9TELE|nr:hypothetical protein EYF80_048742 [Liparis tanakae]
MDEFLLPALIPWRAARCPTGPAAGQISWLKRAENIFIYPECGHETRSRSSEHPSVIWGFNYLDRVTNPTLTQRVHLQLLPQADLLQAVVEVGLRAAADGLVHRVVDGLGLVPVAPHGDTTRRAGEATIERRTQHGISGIPSASASDNTGDPIGGWEDPGPGGTPAERAVQIYWTRPVGLVV